MRFLRPDLIRWWLVIPLLVASWGLHWHLTRRARERTRVADRFAPLSRRTTRRREIAVLAAAIVVAAALVVSLMRPQVPLARRVAEYERQDLIVMLDRSVSMRADDVAPSRFSRATLELRTLLQQKPEGIDRVGLVGFADGAIVLSYLTADVESVLFYLEWLDDDATVFFGTNIGAALKSAVEIAKKDDRPTRKRFLLVSDGEDRGTELAGALDTITAAGYRVDCIGVGSEALVPIPLPGDEPTYLRDDAGRRVMTKFEEGTLRRVAATTGGRFVRSTTGTELARAIADVAKGERRLVGWRTTTEYRDLHPIGLAVAAVAGAALWLLL
jgi:Ca-activated chloride channel homolog